VRLHAAVSCVSSAYVGTDLKQHWDSVLQAATRSSGAARRPGAFAGASHACFNCFFIPSTIATHLFTLLPAALVIVPPGPQASIRQLMRHAAVFPICVPGSCLIQVQAFQGREDFDLNDDVVFAMEK
jgi:hypothetical protein